MGEAMELQVTPGAVSKRIMKLDNVYQRIYDFENLYQAYLQARKGKRYREDVLRFSTTLEESLIQIQRELMTHTYEIGKYREFYVYEPKKRLIMAQQFRDRVVQWAIYRELNPFFDSKFIADSYGCRDEKGSLRAADRLQYWLCQVSRRPEPYYYMKLGL